MGRTIRICVAGALVASLATALPAGADSHLETVLTGVDNGRGLAFDDAGNLYVASSGTGGEGPCISSPEGEGSSCYGETGAILRLDAADIGGTAEAAGDQVLVDGLPSHAPQEGEFAQGDAAGPADVAIGDDGRVYFTIGLGADPAVRDGDLDPAASADEFATLQSAADDGSDVRREADLGAHEAGDPDGEGADTNPFGLVVDTGDQLAIALDSGGNTVLEVDLADGSVTTGAVLPPTFMPVPSFIGMPNGTNIPSQSVPTQLDWHPDGGVVLGELTGFPFAPGGARTWAYDGTLEPMVQGFTNIMDVAWHDGSLYVLELVSEGLLSASLENPPMGALIRVTEDADGTVTRELLVDDVLMPGGLAIDEDDHAYMTLGSGLPAGAPVPGAGEVVRLDLAAAQPLLTVVDDRATTDEDERLVVDVAANDAGVTTVTPLATARGAVTLEGGDVAYQPAARDAGQDMAPYRACDDDGHCVNGVLTVTIDATATDRLAGATRVLTAVEASMAHFPDGAPAVVVARADLYPDALAGGPLASAVGAPILLTGGDALDAATAAEIRRLGPGTAYVLGGTAALSQAVEQAVGDLVPDTQRLQGRDRYQTAARVMDAIEDATGSAAVKAFVVEGRDADPARGWPDAVAVSALASSTRTPILLVETHVLPGPTARALDGLGQATIVGGEVAVGTAVRAAIGDLVDEVSEVAGRTRYATSRMIAQSQVTNGGAADVVVVSGGNWPDALVAGPLAGMRGDALILVHPSDLGASPASAAFLRDNAFGDVDLYGGHMAISRAVERGIAEATS